MKNGNRRKSRKLNVDICIDGYKLCMQLVNHFTNIYIKIKGEKNAKISQL